MAAHKESTAVAIAPVDSPVRHEAVSVPDSVPVDGDALEVSLLWALHQAGSCLGEQVALIRDKGAKFLIRGVVDSVERRQQILGRLAEVAGQKSITTELLTVEETSQASLNPTSNPTSLPPTMAPALETKTAGTMDGELLRFFKDQNRNESNAELQRRIADFSNASVNRANSALAEAWAIRTLSERFPPSRMSVLSPDSRSLVNSMLQDHLRSLRDGISGMSEQIGPVERSLTEISEPGDWHPLALKVFSLASEVHGEILRVFASAGARQGGPPDSLRKLRTDLNDLFAAATRCSIQANQDISN